jgi:hypothetical protein
MEKWGRMLEPWLQDAGGNVQMWGVNPAKQHKVLQRAYKTDGEVVLG